MTEDAPTIAPLIPAATVIPIRDGAEGLEVLMVQRNGGRGAFAGFWVFPGGRVDDTDVDDVACAVREADEETGLQFDRSTLVRFSHWTPPVTEPKRFGTWFFLAPIPEGEAGEVRIDEAEIVGHQWATIASLLAQRETDEIRMAPPTFVTLTCLQASSNVAEALHAARSTKPDLYVTTMLKEPDRLVVAWPPDAALVEGATLDSEGPRHRLHMNQSPWVYHRA
jgi:8-oxo-dGTP pyrophosphatase MutT (NUDIX family)